MIPETAQFPRNFLAFLRLRNKHSSQCVFSNFWSFNKSHLWW